MSKPTYHLLIRSYPDSKFATAWVIRRDGAADASLLWGELLLPHAVEELVAALGLPVEREDCPLRVETRTPPACVPVEEQGSLFG